MSEKSWKLWAFDLAIVFSVQFLFLSIAAMYFYADFNYSFFNDLLSDLGRISTDSGKSNLISFILFNSAIILAGLLVIPLFLAMPHMFKNKEGRRSIIAGSLFGSISAIAFIFIGLTPADISAILHGVMLGIGFLFTFPYGVLYAIGIYRNKKYPNLAALINLMLPILLLIAFYIIIEFPTNNVIDGTGQKILVYAEITCITYTAYSAKKLYLNDFSPPILRIEIPAFMKE